MKIFESVCICLLGLIFVAKPFHVDNMQESFALRHKKVLPLAVDQFFTQTDVAFDGARVVTDPQALLAVSRDALRYLTVHKAKRPQIVNPIGFRTMLPISDVEQTLRFIIKTIEEDAQSEHQRILDPAFIAKNFDTIAWKADWQSAARQHIKMPHDGRIRLTSYAIFTAKGSRKKTVDYPCGLYELIDTTMRKKYTKQNILAGALDRPENRNKRRALAWVSRQGLEDALMQGTVLVRFQDGSVKTLNVDQHNGIAYDRAQKNVLAQKRYWFFRELKIPTDKVRGVVKRFKQRKDVIFAGDLHNVGLGKVIALAYHNPVTKRHELRLGVLADTGGAFTNNLYQLDLFGGIFSNRNQLKKYLKQLPAAPQAYILCRHRS